jgi:GNAT superfamily N-acetyltransferase
MIASGYRPGAIGRVAEMHASYYSRDWDFGLYFEAKVATELAEFLLRFQEGRDGLWLAIEAERIMGSLALDGSGANREGVQLRWFILDGAARGAGLGNRLMEAAMGFCRARGYDRVYLKTFRGLEAARHLYEKNGFRLVHEAPGKFWGNDVMEQRFECNMTGFEANVIPLRA